jgi:hypothetical protein
VFQGFEPVDNPPTLNLVKAGASVPLKFSLTEDRGLDIFAAGSPSSRRVTCDSSAPVEDDIAAATSGNSGLSYDVATTTYTYAWKTEKSWTRTCRELTLALDDGSSYRALFKFK